MAGYLSMKMKRKGLEEVYDEFSDFSLSSPARKIRRLDAELPPIMEEEETPEIPVVFDRSPSGDLGISAQQSAATVTEVLPYAPLNEERALVLYKPMNKPLVEVIVNSDLIPALRNHVFWSEQTNQVRRVEDEATDRSNSNIGIKNDCLAVVPWVPTTQLSPDSETGVPAAMVVPEQMEAEGVDSVMMEIEQDDNEIQVSGGQAREIGGGVESEGESWQQQWQQQHCLSPQLPQNTSTPIMWSW
ncbi:uncharacterized protein LOC122661537 [Telopea speciosissima]|uniref:uncharacterized protein LOC122661537 n=1 Tax=Telopea speciosissima TaxID=54955 RepID=UPI001CC38BA8|nr:uncharacterized protein LOC122661537 [Telopea speciosissima]